MLLFMIKNGFKLAEVLITLVIIGIIAAKGNMDYLKEEVSW